jgi:hypothetical protein
MVTYHKVAELSQTDAAYIAGVIDGEGTVTLTRKHSNENRQLAVTISNTELRLLEFVLAAVGAGKITRKRTSKTKHTPSVLVQRIFMSPNRVIDLRIDCSYCILQHRILTELIFGGHDVCKLAATAD